MSGWGANETSVEEAQAPPAIDSHGGKIGVPDPILSLMPILLLLISPIAALIYGFVFSQRPPSALRTVIKTLAVGALAVAVAANVSVAATCKLSHCPGFGGQAAAWLPLLAGFALCAIGDAFLAGDPKRWLTPGLVAFLVGHLAFILLFATSPETQAFGPVVFAAMAVVILTGAGMLRWLWPDLGPMRWPVVAYVLVIVVMVCEGLTHWSNNIAWAIGGLLFMASDAILAGQLFKGAKLPGPERLTAWAIWFLYYGAQLAFLAGMIGYAAKV